jgi:hypothetical protein
VIKQLVEDTRYVTEALLLEIKEAPSVWKTIMLFVPETRWIILLTAVAVLVYYL